MFLIVSPKKYQILNTIECDLPNDPYGMQDIYTINKAENELISQPTNYDLNICGTPANYVQLSNRLFCGPKFYSQQLLSNEIFTVYYLKRFYGRFDSALFRLIGHTLEIANSDIMFLILQMLTGSDLIRLMQTPKIIPTIAFIEQIISINLSGQIQHEMQLFQKRMQS